MNSVSIAIILSVVDFCMIPLIECKPNFVIMIMDDMGWGDLGCYGHPAKETPNLDRMAREGMLFTDFYSASGICSPSRASVMTGRLPVRNGFYSTNRFGRNSYAPQDVMGGIADSEVLFPEVLKDAGYKNKIVGKWHLGHQPQYLPLKHGFHEWFGAPNCHYEYDNKAMPNIPVYRNEQMLGRYYDDFKINITSGISNLTQLYIKEALEWIEKQHSEKEPFLLYWAPDSTHTPLYASEQFRGRSKRGLYGDAVIELDYGVGQILKKLEELNLDKDTFVFFSSDNGAATYALTEGGSNGPLLCGKQTTFEGGMREPAIAWWPGKIKPGQNTDQNANWMDIFLTVLDIAGLPHPKGVQFDGQSIGDTLFNSTVTERPTFYYRGDALFKVRYGEYKAHFYTWGSPKDAEKIGYHYCPGQYVEGVTTPNMTDYSKQPLLFHLGRDPGEKFIIDAKSEEYRTVMKKIQEVTAEHKHNMKLGDPQFNYCDLAVQNWAPPGCETIKKCLKAPPSYPYKCNWPY